jgi:cell division septum initiation protein DivIVA
LARDVDALLSGARAQAAGLREAAMTEADLLRSSAAAEGAALGASEAQRMMMEAKTTAEDIYAEARQQFLAEVTDLRDALDTTCGALGQIIGAGRPEQS